MVSKPIDGKSAGHANGGTIGFSMSDPKQVESWHKAGVREWRHDHRGPAWRAPRGRRRVKSRYLRDPDGNKLCALYLYARQKARRGSGPTADISLTRGG